MCSVVYFCHSHIRWYGHGQAPLLGKKWCVSISSHFKKFLLSFYCRGICPRLSTASICPKIIFITRGSTQGPWEASFLRSRVHTSKTLGDIQQGQRLRQRRRQGQLRWKRRISWRFWFSGNKANSFRGGVRKWDNGLVALKCEALIDERAQLLFEEGGRYCTWAIFFFGFVMDNANGFMVSYIHLEEAHFCCCLRPESRQRYH